MPHDPKVIPIMRGHARPPGIGRRTLRHASSATHQRCPEPRVPAKAFPTAADTLAFLKLHPGGVQCLLADLGLPDMDGGELTQRARDVVPGLRVVLMAARGERGVAELLPAYRYLPCLPKPVFRDQLAAAFKRVIGPPPAEPSTRASMGRPRSRRRPSGSHPA